MTKMNAAIQHAFGVPTEVIVLEQTEVPSPGAGEVLIKLAMSAIHNHDLITVRGEYGIKPALPAIGGSEGTGMIAAVGEGVTGLTVGTRVAVAGAQKVWAEYFVAPVSAVSAVPDSIDDEAAAQILGMPMDALLAFNSFDVKAGDWLVVNAASGAIGKDLSTIARSHRVKTAMLVRNEPARDELTALGYENVFVTEGDGWKNTVRSAIGDARVAGGVDMVGGQATGDLVSLVSEFGLILSFGGMSNQPASFDIGEMIFKQVTLRGQWSHRRFQLLAPREIEAMRAELFALVSSGELVLPVHKVYPLSQSAEAMAASAAPHQGKVLIAA